MKKSILIFLMSVSVLSLLGCGSEKKSATPATDKNISRSLKNQSSPNSSKPLPEFYPKEAVPLAVDAKIFDIKENIAAKSLEIMYATNNDINTVCDFYESAFKNFEKLETTRNEMSDITISAQNDGETYIIMLYGENLMKHLPEFANKKTVVMNLRNLKNFPGTQKAIKQAKKSLAWPTSELPGVPELVGHITNIIREDNAIYFNVEVADNSVQNYPAELTKAGFTIEDNPDITPERMQFMASKGNSMLNFAYKDKEKSASFEYHK